MVQMVVFQLLAILTLLVLTVILKRVTWVVISAGNEEIMIHIRGQVWREPLTALDVTTLLGLGATGSGLGAALHQRVFEELRMQIEFNIDKVED